MALTIDELKNRYHEIVLKRADAIYFSWGNARKVSKQIVAKAKEYAFDERLKVDWAFRFEVFAFTHALGMRLKKRYNTRLRKLFRIFAFLRERDAFNILKQLLNWDDGMDIRELLDIEIENLFIVLSQYRDRHSQGGGKRVEIGELWVEEKIEKFLEACALEELEKSEMKASLFEKAKGLETPGKTAPEKVEISNREKISVDEKKDVEQGVEKEKVKPQASKKEERKQENLEQKQTESPEGKKVEKSTEKSVANASILAEIMIAEQRREKVSNNFAPPSQKVSDEKSSVAEKEVSAERKEENARKVSCEEDAPAENDSRIEFNRGRGLPFVGRNEDAPSIKNFEKPIEKPIEKPKDEPTEEFLDLGLDKELRVKEEIPIYETMDISEENRERIKLNITMCKPQIQAITSQLQKAAQMIMEEEERAWREKISVAEGKNTVQTQASGVVNHSNNDNTIYAIKK
jgi:hypothetical protein